ncbi:hypothetical protein [Thermococcus cleftensis]|uniref:hypothetical protein n=1 Tax=Thermococcus cleftensis (strain DSM 27260 / KACC 17922 / CL1) TaxID=163003 RepID=UPI00064F8508|nr:hypothetical protein [Thermococcus cleftensis]
MAMFSEAKGLASRGWYLKAIDELDRLLPLAETLGNDTEIRKLGDGIKVDSLLDEAENALKRRNYLNALAKYREAYNLALKVDHPKKLPSLRKNHRDWEILYRRG